MLGNLSLLRVTVVVNFAIVPVCGAAALLRWPRPGMECPAGACGVSASERSAMERVPEVEKLLETLADGMRRGDVGFEDLPV